MFIAIELFAEKPSEVNIQPLKSLFNLDLHIFNTFIASDKN